RLVTGGKMIQNFPYWLKEFLQLGPSRMLMRLRRKMRLAKKVAGQPGVGDFQRLDATDIIDFAPELPAYRQELITSHYQAMKMYVPQTYPGHVTLFRAKSRPLLNTFDPEVGWQKLAPGRVNVVDVPSSHEGMFRKPHVNHLAQALKSCIDRASGEMQHFQTAGFQSGSSANLLSLLFPIIVMPLLM
ncbi:MAG: thioesterase domain-containing protein, partial [Anaerolineales bacterium]